MGANVGTETCGSATAQGAKVEKIPEVVERGRSQTLKYRERTMTDDDDSQQRQQLLRDAEANAVMGVHLDVDPMPQSRGLPQSIYGAAMMAAIRSSHHTEYSIHGITTAVYIGLALNVLMQAYVLYCTKIYITAPAVRSVQHLYNKYHEEVWADGIFSVHSWEAFDARGELCQLPFSQPLFFMAILVVWTGTCWLDLKESIRFVVSWFSLPTCASGSKAEIDEDSGNFVITEASKATKGFVVSLILVPKIVIAMLLWWLGARWLAATPSFQDLILNGVALAFITELDELMYHVLLPEDIDALVMKYELKLVVQRPSRTTVQDQESLREKSGRRLLERLAGMAFSIVVVVAIPWVYLRYAQQVLPNYQWDVHEPCISYTASLDAR